ncbi:PREDICTED: uncharacterized protein LOC106128344 [Papilio xuthus]|uniref:Uncharacterized protein LOC106128344 n=1 Tax=Papilio xuthus TaxID=66420 RepID=A0AAJ7ELC5_PAPXU|nr:PREDICTED: uncharacterized protein LOC106128344 [Papilio xuthus]XP_013182128.1 PREDICTED: uncharacterized protein LOC106128344 [Papilio xuthus]XP_013182129.1 PREDICTED: uncharacterized protein LOC106128344 [Papilio xuthus]XP_013182130.1 PREDICTED: uncharacterized protein LOC106128344 [Papilio xuthus]XP_013182131.1 PREDICTED: uncharacterized protein LOC106128344 [Papilio xuthus]
MVSERSPVYGVAPPLPARPRTFRRNCGDQVSVTSPTKVYIETSAKSPHYSANDEQTGRRVRRGLNDDFDDRVTVIKVLEQTCWLCIRTVLQDGEIEIQDLVAFIDGDSSDSGHFYESLEPAPPVPAHPAHMAHIAHETHVAHTAHAAHGAHASAGSHVLPLEDDFDSFDSDTDSEDHEQSGPTRTAPEVPSTRLPTPPNGGGPYTLTKIANAAQKKMRQIKRNLTKRYTVAMDGKPFAKPSQQNGTYDLPKPKMRSPIYANYERPEPQSNYTNIAFNESRNLSTKSDNTVAKVGFKEESKAASGDKRHSNGDAGSPQEKPTTPTNETKKDTGTLSRKTYFSFKSRFRRASSMAVDLNSEVPSALKITNSTFYLTDSMDGDSGFSNCSDSGATNTDTLSASSRRRDELKRLLPTLSRKDKGPRTRTSWYAECEPAQLTTTPSW